HPDQYQPTRRLDARFRLLKESSSSIKHGDEVKFFVSASETIATLRLLGTEELNPGEEAWIQLELREPVVAVRGDRYILRRPSPGETLGGGIIVDHHPKGRHKRFDEEILKSLDALAHGSPADVLLEAAMALNAAPITEIVTRSRLDSINAEVALNELLSNNSLITLEEGTRTINSEVLAVAAPHWNASRDKIMRLVEAYHKAHPLRRGIPREELKSRLKLSARVFNAIIHKLTVDHSLTDHSAFVAQTGHEIAFNRGEQAKVQELMRRFDLNPFSPPGIKEIKQWEVGEEILNALLETDILIMVSPDVIFRKVDYDFMVLKIREKLTENGRITLAEVRDLFNTSRKYAQALMEHLDANGITRRDGDFRKLSK
nr:SelB C-terminal domain-containing protein [Chloroflexota bacterium]